MGFSPRTVLIPLAGARLDSGRIARIQADGNNPGRDGSELNAQIADLADWQLYEAGAIALGAVKRLQLRPRRSAILQRLTTRSAPAYLSVTNGPDIVGLHSDNTQSAELGLAVAALMYAGQSRARSAIATGCLSRETAPGSGSSDDVGVLPVGQLAEKIETIRRAPEIYKGGAYPARMVFFLPEETVDGGETLKEHAEEIAALQDAFREHGTDIEVVAVSTLRDAITKLGVRALDVTHADRVFSGALAAAAITAFLAAPTWAWFNAPIELAFDKITLDNGERVDSPVRAAFDTGEQKYVLKEDCLGPQRLPVYRAGDSVVLRVAAKPESTLAAILGGYDFAVVTVSEHSGVKIFPQETFGGDEAHAANNSDAEKVVPTQEKKWGVSAVLPVERPAEKNKIVILARRSGPFEPDALRRALEDAIDGKPASQRINAAVTYLAKRAPGYLDYSFLSSEGELQCSPL